MKPRLSALSVSLAVVFVAGCYCALRTASRDVVRLETLGTTTPTPPIAQAKLTPSLGATQMDPVGKMRSRLLAWKAEGDALRRCTIQDELLAFLTDANAGDIVRALPEDLLDTPFGEIALTRWATVDRRAAAEWMGRLAGATAYQAGLVTYGWLASDRAGLHAFLDAQPNASLWKQAVATAATNDALLLHDGPEAIALLNYVSPQPQRDEMLGWATTEWAMKDPASAAEWTRRVQDSTLQAKLFGAAVTGYAWKDPIRAAELLIHAQLPEKTQAAVLTNVMNIWSATAPGDAARWANENLTGTLQRLAIRSALTFWEQREPAAAEVWVEQLPSGPLRRQADLTLRKVAAAAKGVEQSDEFPSGRSPD